MTSKYQMWLTYNGGTEKIRFPVLPEIINIKKGSANKSVSIAGLGEVVIKQDPAAAVISFSCFFPATPFPGVQFEKLTPPKTIAAKIDAWKNCEKPVQFLVTGTEINLFCDINFFDYYEKAGDVGTIHYSIMLKEYREVKARQIKIENTKAVLPASAPARVDNRAPEKTHTVVKGDTLWAIAKKHLGNGARYSEIASLNSDIVKNPSLIHIGWVLRLPS